MKDNTEGAGPKLPLPESAAENQTRPVYHVGDVIIFKYEGNVRAEVIGHQVIDRNIWLEARAAELSFLVPSHQVVGIEPEEVM